MSRETKEARVHRTETGIAQRNNSGDKYLTEYYLVYIYEETTWGKEKNDERILEGAVPGPYTRSE